MFALFETRARRRRQRRYRQLAAALILLAPAILMVVADVARRPSHVAGFDRPHLWGYVGTAFASALFWAVLLHAAAARRGPARQLAAGLFGLLYTLAFGVQAAFHGIFNIYLSHDAQIYARSVPWAVIGYLPARPIVLLQLGAALLASLACLVLARRWLRASPQGRWTTLTLLIPVLIGMSQIPASYRSWQSSTPDVIYFHGLMSLGKEHLRLSENAPELRVQRRSPPELPPIAAAPARPRNVLFILQESLRHDVVCAPNEPLGTCATQPSSRAAPGRLPLDQLRASASTTAISISNLWAGVSPIEGLDVLTSVPLLWDFADAAGWDSAYWTSQNVMFGSMRLYVQDLPARHFAYGTTLDPEAHYDAGAHDRLLTDWAIEHWDDLREPFFAVVHYSNVHFPYVYDPAHAPFQPAAFTREVDRHEEFFNYYKDVVYLSDLAVGRLLDHVRQSDKGARTVVLYTSDHGEAFREHWQIGHTSSLYDEEIHVPGWIDAPPGTLAPEEEAAIRGARQQLTWHYDLTATMLDLMGLWDAPEIAPHRARMIGRPITRPERTVGLVPLSNCSWLWQCGFRSWGLMKGRLKLEAREWANEFHCFDVLADPLEEHDLGEDACTPLGDLGRAMFGPMPFEEWPDPKTVVWGPPSVSPE